MRGVGVEALPQDGINLKPIALFSRRSRSQSVARLFLRDADRVSGFRVDEDIANPDGVCPLCSTPCGVR